MIIEDANYRLSEKFIKQLHLVLKNGTSDSRKDWFAVGDYKRFANVPFIITEELKLYYYRGLKEWKYERGYLRDACLTAQDQFKLVMDYFKVPYESKND